MCIVHHSGSFLVPAHLSCKIQWQKHLYSHKTSNVFVCHVVLSSFLNLLFLCQISTYLVR